MRVDAIAVFDHDDGTGRSLVITEDPAGELGATVVPEEMGRIVQLVLESRPRCEVIVE